MTQASSSAVRTILAAMDFSDNAVGALDWAQEIARAHDARLVLFHALQPPVGAVAAPEFVALPPEVYEEQEQRTRQLLEEHAAKRREGGTNVEAQLRLGPSGPTIVDAARHENADLIVVGTRGLTGLKRTFLGSVAARVIRDAPCPVLAVPAEEAGSHRPIRRVLVPTDFSDDARLAVEASLRLLGPVAAEMKVTLLHVWRVPIIFSPWATFPMEQLEQATAADAQRHLDEAAAGLRRAGFEVETKECQGEPADVIDREAKELGADVIAMGTHGRSGLSRVFLGSVAERTLPTAPCPVLTVHYGEQAAS